MLDALRPVAEHASRAAVLIDFDGTLAPIVDDPDRAAPLPAARDAVAALTGLVPVLAVVSGRPVRFLVDALGLDGVTYVGHYGLERWTDGVVVTDPRVEAFTAAVGGVAAAAERELPEVRVERKGTVSVGLHWRGRGAEETGARVTAFAARAARETGLDVHPGRMVVELRPPVAVDKGTVVEQLTPGLDVAAFAGDDVGDLAAFAALDRLQDAGRLVHAVRIAVRSPEEPPGLVAAADVSVDGPAGLAAALRDLADAIRRAPA